MNMSPEVTYAISSRERERSRERAISIDSADEGDEVLTALIPVADV
jgi:hypothetical protein